MLSSSIAQQHRPISRIEAIGSRLIRSDAETCLKIFQSLICFPPPPQTIYSFIVFQRRAKEGYSVALLPSFCITSVSAYGYILCSCSLAPYNTLFMIQHNCVIRQICFHCAKASLTILFAHLLDNFLFHYRNHFVQTPVSFVGYCCHRRPRRRRRCCQRPNTTTTTHKYPHSTRTVVDHHYGSLPLGYFANLEHSLASSAPPFNLLLLSLFSFVLRFSSLAATTFARQRESL